MRTGVIALLAVLVVGLVFVTGCTSSSGSTPPPTGPIGGGCGVAPSADAGVAEIVADVETTAAL